MDYLIKPYRLNHHPLTKMARMKSTAVAGNNKLTSKIFEVIQGIRTHGAGAWTYAFWIDLNGS